MSSRPLTPDSDLSDSPWRTVPDSPEFRKRKGEGNQSEADSEKSNISEVNEMEVNIISQTTIILNQYLHLIQTIR